LRGFSGLEKLSGLERLWSLRGFVA
jgi:hypothetical protein